MPEKAIGFLTTDGMFFTEEHDAKYHESAEEIRESLARDIQLNALNSDLFFTFLENNINVFSRHCENVLALRRINSPSTEEEEHLTELNKEEII